jgi:hypothetical protein
MLNLTQSNYITTQIQLPLNLEVIFKGCLVHLSATSY